MVEYLKIVLVTGYAFLCTYILLRTGATAIIRSYYEEKERHFMKDISKIKGGSNYGG